LVDSIKTFNMFVSIDQLARCHIHVLRNESGSDGYLNYETKLYFLGVWGNLRRYSTFMF